MLILPEITLMTGAFACFVLSLGKPDNGQLKSAVILFGILTGLFSVLSLGLNGTLFQGSYVVDPFSQMLKAVAGLGIAAVAIFGFELRDVDEEIRAEYFMFLFLCGLGLMMLVSSVELIAIFVALELSSFSLYLMVPMRSDRNGRRFQMEAGMKYLLFGVMATGFMLFGMSYLFGLTGSTYLDKILAGLKTIGPSPAVLFAVIMVLAGFFYKLAIFPFHFWVPDTYQGSANETTSFIATIPKLGAVALLIRVMILGQVSGPALVNLLIVLAVASMFYGNLCALAQKDVKRMLGFSGIAHAGFMLAGILTMDEAGYGASMYYVMGYVFMNLACFLVLCKVATKGENLVVEDLNGLHNREPLMALTLAVGLFAMAGIPPFVGFMGKFMILATAFKHGYTTLVILAALNTAIAIYYYLSVVRAAYTTDPEDRPAVAVDGLTKTVSIVLMLFILIMGVIPAQIVGMATAAVKMIM